MPGKIKSKAQAAYLAIHNKPVLHELSGGSIPNFKSLPQHVKSSGPRIGRNGSPSGMGHQIPGLIARHFGGKR
jgi:hypothetical protein